MVETWNSKHIHISQLELKVIECARRCVGHLHNFSFDAYYKLCKLDGISTYSRGAVAERSSGTAVELTVFTWASEGRQYPHCAHIPRLSSLLVLTFCLLCKSGSSGWNSSCIYSLLSPAKWSLCSSSASSLQLALHTTGPNCLEFSVHSVNICMPFMC